MSASRFRPGGTIVLVPYDPGWAAEFEREASRVAASLGTALVAVHHIGSTAIPGIVAKPVIDMLAEVTPLGVLDQYPESLVSLGYEAMGAFGIAGRRYFRKTNADGVRTHQVHAFESGFADVRRHLAFRDYLKAHEGVARDYESLKLRLASECGTNIDCYSEGKTDFVRRVERLALMAGG